MAIQPYDDSNSWRSSPMAIQQWTAVAHSCRLLVLNAAVLVDPVNHLAVPYQRVFRPQHPLVPSVTSSSESLHCDCTHMVLVGEHDQLAGNVPSLQHVEHGQTLRHWQTVVEFVVNYLYHGQQPIGDSRGNSAHQLRRRPILSVERGIPFCVNVSALPKGAAKVVLWEEELLGGPLVLCRKHTVVAHKGLELPPQIMALYPVYPVVSA